MKRKTVAKEMGKVIQLIRRTFPGASGPHPTSASGADRSGANAGLSMIELVIVVAIIGGFTAMVISTVITASEGVKEKQARVAFNNLESALQMYRLNHFKFPTTEQGLDALFKDPGRTRGRWRGPYTKPDLIIDPWGEEVAYESDGRRYKLISAGKDSEMGTTDDIIYPEEEIAE